MTGQNKERELARQLADAGYAVMRAPASGSATTRDLPDLLWAKDGCIVAGELKYTGENVAYYDAEEVAALDRFGKAFGANVRLVARFKQDTNFYSLKPEQARRTDSGRYAVDRILPVEVVE